jgi:glycosyltransferase involved in cell wall biosynthesis
MQVTLDLSLGGMERVITTLGRTLDRSRFEVSVLCLRGRGPYAEELEACGVPVFDLGGRPDRGDHLAFWKIARVLREQRIQVLHTHNTATLFDSWPAAKLARVPRMIHTDHARDFPDKLRYMVAEHLISHFIDKMVAVSEHTASNLTRYEKISPRRIVTIPNGIEGELYAIDIDRASKRLEIGVDDDGPIIGLAARLTEQKGVVYLLQALGMLRERFPTLRVAIAGEGPLEEELRNAAVDLQVADRVLFLGPRLDIPELLQVFDLYALPSVWEGLPLAVLEAMAAGCPIVASDVGGVASAVRDGVSGVLVEPRQPVALAEAIAHLLREPALRRRYAHEARRTFEASFSAAAMTRRYETLYLA